MKNLSTDISPAECDRRGDSHYRVSLRDYVESELSSLQKQIDLRFASSEQALRKAEEALLLRFDSVNKFREQLSDERVNLVSKPEYQLAHEILQSKIGFNTSRLDKIEGAKEGTRATQDNSRANIALIISIASGIGYILMTVLSLLKH